MCAAPRKSSTSMTAGILVASPAWAPPSSVLNAWHPGAPGATRAPGWFFNSLFRIASRNREHYFRRGGVFVAVGHLHRNNVLPRRQAGQLYLVGLFRRVGQHARRKHGEPVARVHAVLRMPNRNRWADRVE